MMPRLCLLAFAVAVHSLPLAAAAPTKVDFNRDIRPILSDNCFACHGSDAAHRKGKRRLDTPEGAYAERNDIRAIVPGKPGDSDAWLRIVSTNADEQMPPTDSHKPLLTDTQRELIKRWIEEGAVYQKHWAFELIGRPAVPTLFPAEANPIDAFVRARLAAAKLAPSPEAARGPLLRRVTLDLTGLPPTLAELDEFLADARPDAYERAVDRLLASPRYGERLALDWLDVARYADTNGYQGDAYRMNWPWRDWVVNAFNANQPFDRFTIEQLAGDLLPNPTQAQLIATAFNRNHPLNAEGGSIPEENRTKNVFDRVETTSGTWLGLTMQCAQCHDHKFDPTTQADYFSLFAMFNQLSEPGGVDKRFGRKAYSDDYDKLYSVESPFISVGTPEHVARLEVARTAKKAAEAALEAQRTAFWPPFVTWMMEMRANPDLIPERVTEDGLRRNVLNAPLDKPKDGKTRGLLDVFLKSQPQWRPLVDAIRDALDEENDAQYRIPLVMVMRDDKPRPTRILERGNYETPGAVVAPNTPSFLPPLPEGVKADRLALARWLVAPEQPLMPRVVVNRYWQLFFGRGLVKTPEDFGLQGAWPSHPELLDWLASDFRNGGWDLKRLIRLIVTSRTYRQSALATPAILALDPENVLLARGPRVRLDSRFIRDQALALSGLLVEQRGGFPVMPYQPPGIWEDISFGKNRYFQGHGDDLHRRSLYTFWRRSVAPANFFDAPTRQVCTVKPQRTNTPLQALTTLNDTTYVEAARVWAEKLSAVSDDPARLRQLLRAATAREPEPREIAALQTTLAKARANFSAHSADAEKLVAIGEAPRTNRLPAVEHAAWTTVCLLVLNLDETLSP
jgi:mono/diheme cytochrome c family protein